MRIRRVAQRSTIVQFLAIILTTHSLALNKNSLADELYVCVTTPSWICHIVRKPLEIQSLTTSGHSYLESLIWFKIWGDFTLPIPM